MKRFFSLLLFAFACSLSHAQEWISSGNDIISNKTGNVGIGITNPTEKLDVSGTIKNTYITLGVSSANGPQIVANYNSLALRTAQTNQNISIYTNGARLTIHDPVTGGVIRLVTSGNTDRMEITSLGVIQTRDAAPLRFGVNQSEVMRLFPTTNNVGIGLTADQGYKLNVNGNIRSTGLVVVDGTQGVGKVLTSDVNGVATWQIPAVGGGSLWTDAGAGSIYTNSSKVGIGVTQVPNDYKLAIAGNVIAEKVKVALQANWPDYVFEKHYRLMPLNELEKFIGENKHLPDMPAQKEVRKNGIDLGDN